MRCVLMRPVWALVVVSLVVPLVAAQAPIGTAVTYQGRLKDTGALGNDNYDFEFKLYDDPAVGVLIGTDTADDWPVAEGLFTVWLDFGAGAFNGKRRWLQIGVRPWDSGGAYTALAPRQELTPTPYGLYSATADTVDGFHAAAAPAANTLLPLNGAGKFPNSVLMTGAGNGLDADLLDGQHGAFYQNASNLNAGTLPSARLSGSYTNALTFSNAANSFTGNGAGLTSLNASNISSGTLADGRLSSNVALLDNAQIFTGAKQFSVAPSFTAAGTPFFASSSTLVSNLNSDLLDGQTGSFYQNSSNQNAGTLADARLSSNVALLNTEQTFTAIKHFTGNVSMGTSTAPQGTLDVRGGNQYFDTGGGNFIIRYAATNDGWNFATSGQGANLWLREDPNGTDIWTRMAWTAGGNVGVGTTSPDVTLHVATGTDVELASGGYFEVGLPSGANITLDNNEIMARNNGVASTLYLNNDGGDVYVGGDVGVGTTPSAPLHVASSTFSSSSYGVVHGESTVATNDTPGVYGEHAVTDYYGIGVKGVGGYRGVEGRVSPTGSSTYTGVYGYVSGGTGSNRGVYGYAYGTGTTNYGVYGYAGGATTNYAGYFSGTLYCTGTTNTDVLTIRGGADVAERFDVTDEVKAGMVVAIDPDQPGKMCVARGAYNPRVAGVISGANELAAGMVLGEFAGCENAQPVALTGRVWTYCDASDKAIEPGDLLTTSDRAGYAMAATDRERSHGAVIGKAMSRLAKGQSGLVLVLVNLQ